MSNREDPSHVFMQRCFDLARLGAGRVSPNPMVGAVLVYKNQIIGEGYHQAYGQAHAEVNAVNSVLPKNRSLIFASTLYVSLEPCCIHGNTPPCTELIIRHKIPKVVIASLDQSADVSGRGVQQLRDAGIQVETSVQNEAGNHLSATRNIFVTKGRPYVILKYAQTADGFIGHSDGSPLWISNLFAKRLVHKWRSESDAILVSGKTARLDNPQLTNRLYFGSSPQRIILDRQLELVEDLHIFDQTIPTLIAHDLKLKNTRPRPGIAYLPVLAETNLQPLLSALQERRISTLLVEGGAMVLQSFINQNLWDEARVFQSTDTLLTGLPSPHLTAAPSVIHQLDDNLLKVYFPRE